MAIPSGWNGKALSPTVIVTDLDDVEQFRFESESVDPSPTQDFRLNALGIHAGINDDHGNSLMIIEDSDNIMTNTDVRRASKLNRQWNLKVNLGKGVTGDRWFTGKILASDIIRSRTGEQWIKILSGGWGMRSMERISTIERTQSRASDGLTFEPTDTATTIENLVNDIWQDEDHFVLRSLGLESDISLNVQANTLKLSEFKDYYQSWSFLMSRLAAVSGSVWGINPDKEVFFREPKSVSSEILLSSDETNVITTKWNPAKLCYITSPLEWSDGVGDSGYSVIHAPGATRDSLDLEVDPTVNADFNLSNNWLAIEWTPTQATLSKIAARFKKVGTPASGDAFFLIVGATSGGSPNINDVRKKVRIPVQVLNSFALIDFPITGAAFMKEYSFEKIQVEPNEKLFAVFEKYGDGSNHYVLQYDSAGALTYWTSSDGTSWASSTGDFAFRAYPTRTLNVVLYNCAAAKRFGVREKVIDLRNFTDINALRQTLFGLAEIMGREKRQFKPLITTVPDNYVEPGKSIKILDTYGLNTDAIMLGWDISMSADEKQNKLGANEITWNVGDFI